MVNATDPDVEKIKRKNRWLRWKGGVLLREARLIEKLRKSIGTHRPH